MVKTYEQFKLLTDDKGRNVKFFTSRKEFHKKVNIDECYNLMSMKQEDTTYFFYLHNMTKEIFAYPTN